MNDEDTIIVAIEQTITRYVEVRARGPKAAKAVVEDYGVQEAFSDFKEVKADVTTRAYLPKKPILR